MPDKIFHFIADECIKREISNDKRVCNYLHQTIKKFIGLPFTKEIKQEMKSILIDALNQLNKVDITCSAMIMLSKKAFAKKMITIAKKHNDRDINNNIFDGLANNFSFFLFEEHSEALFSIIRRKALEHSEVDFDYENLETCFNYSNNTAIKNNKERLKIKRTKYPMELAGLRKIEDNNYVMVVVAGGDWEMPVCTFIYWNGHKFVAYAPKEGNRWNHSTKTAIGNGDELTDSKYEGNGIYDIDLMINDFKQYIQNKLQVTI